MPRPLATLRALSSALLASLPAAGCVVEPPLEEGAAPPEAVTLSGDLVLTDADRTGPGIVLRYDAADPPPPLGLGRPVDLASVPDAWTRPTEGAMASAPWTMTGVEDGTWLLTGLVDVDGDFNPAFDFTAGATCGDLPGAFLGSPTDDTPLPLAVSAPDHVEGVDLLFGDPIPIERPAFTVDEATRRIDQLSAETQVIQVHATGISHPLLDLAPPDAEACPTLFWLTLVDEDGDGAVDPHPNEDLAAAGFAATWPRLYLLLVAPEDPSVVADGSTWITELPLYQGLGQVGGTPATTPLTDLLGVWPGAVLRIAPDGTQEVVAPPDIPTGGWGLLVVAETGQTWMVPNQLASQEVADALCAAGVSCQAPDPEQGVLVELAAGG